jgi:hypothetical protein
VGFFYTIVGWFVLNDDLRSQVMKIVHEDKDALGHYRDSWCFPEIGGGYSRVAFYGSTVRDSAVADIKTQMARIAHDSRSTDGEDSDFVEGLIHVTAEDRSCRLIWRIADGQLSEREEEPNQQSAPREIRLHEISRGVGEILHYLWDPIGVAGIVGARDEYDSYSSVVTGMLMRGANEAEISSYLTATATETMGLAERQSRDADIAKLLIKHFADLDAHYRAEN